MRTNEKQVRQIIREEIKKTLKEDYLYTADRVLQPNELKILNWKYFPLPMNLNDENYLHTSYEAEYVMGVGVKPVGYHALLWMDGKVTWINIYNENHDNIFTKSYRQSSDAIKVFKKLLNERLIIVKIGNKKFNM